MGLGVWNSMIVKELVRMELTVQRLMTEEQAEEGLTREAVGNSMRVKGLVRGRLTRVGLMKIVLMRIRLTRERLTSEVRSD